VTNNNGFWIGFIDAFTVALNYSKLPRLTQWLAPFLTGLRVSSLVLWLTWFWFTNDEGRMTNREEWMRSYLNDCFNRLAVTMENVCCMSVDTETRSIRSPSPGVHISIATCVNFAATLWFSRAYNSQFSYPLKPLCNTHRPFVQESYLRGDVFANSFPTYMSHNKCNYY
jgi:hypothetical protein